MTWSWEFTPLNVIVGADLLGQIVVDVARTTTRIRLIDTT